MARCRERKGVTLQPFDLESSGQVQKEGEEPRPRLDRPQRVVINKGFWRDLPWEQREYYAHTRYIPWVNAINEVPIWQQQVPAGQVLAITSIVSRALLATGVVAFDYAFAHDAYLLSVIQFYLRVSRTVPYDIFTEMNWAGTPDFSGWNILNQEQAVPGIPYVTYARENELIGIYVAQNANPAAPWVAPEQVGVEVRGLYIPIPIFDRYNAEMER